MNDKLLERVYGLLGLARRAGKLVDGQERVLDAVTSKRAALLVVALDAGANGHKKLLDKAATYEVNVFTVPTKSSLGRAIGRAEASAIAVLDPGFAAKLVERFEEINGGGAF